MKKLDKQIDKKILADRGDIHRSGTRLGLAAFFERLCHNKWLILTRNSV